MAIIPNDEQFIGVSSSVDMTEKKSSQVNRATQVYTLQDFSDSLTPDLTPITVDGNSVSIASDPTATTQAMAVIQATTLNSGIAIVPNGTGAITAQVPDGTVVGGSARGANAVDLQMARNSNSQIAARDYSVIVGGERNTVGGVSAAKFSSILGGSTNTVLGSFDGILGGNQNTTNLSGAYNAIGGGFFNRILTPAAYANILGGNSNTVSSNFSTISGGQSNTAGSGTHATVVGGQGNTSSGQHSISGGNGAVASGQSSIALNKGDSRGFGSVAIGGYSGSPLRVYDNFAVGFGTDNEVYGNSAFAFGFGVQTNYIGSLGFGSGKFSTVGDAQQSYLTARKFDDLTTGGTTVLSLDGTGTTNLIIPNGNNRVWNVVASWVAVVVGTSGTTTGVNVGDVITQCNLFAFKKIGGISSVVGSVTNVATHNDSGMASASMGYTAGASQELALTFTAPTFSGGGSVSLRIVNKLMLTEVAY
jgi:hypothetical protein